MVAAASTSLPQDQISTAMPSPPPVLPYGSGAGMEGAKSPGAQLGTALSHSLPIHHSQTLCELLAALVALLLGEMG